ncbi:MAG: enolase C-terminal domain-like protein [Fuerstiella sp.]
MTQTRIQSLKAFHVRIGLKKPIRHASFTRTQNDTLILRCELSDGSVGWGEGLPRPYVTGETIDSAIHQLETADLSAIGDCDFSDPIAVAHAISLWELRQWEPIDTDTPAERHSIPSVGCDPKKSGFGNSVRCALELAVLDAATRSAGTSLSCIIQDLAEPLGLKQLSGSVRYSGVITSSSGRIAQLRSAIKMRLFGFDAVKVKVGHPEICDPKLLARVRRMVGQKMDVRIDANEAWTPDIAAKQIHKLFPFGISCVEQPLADRHRSHLAELRREVDVPIMLDESLCSISDAVEAASTKSCDAFNIRLSKCGGIMNSLQLMKIAQANGLFVQLGCLVGETGILSAAARHFGCSVGPIRYFEGSYDRFLITDRLTHEDCTFGYGGLGKAIKGHGLGVTVHEADIHRMATRTLRCL